MHIHCVLASYFCIMIMIFVLIHVPASLCDDHEQFVNCGQPFECGATNNIYYPFWGGDRADYCGPQGYRLDCQDGVTLLTIQSRTYSVLFYDNATQTVTVAREEFRGTACPSIFQNNTLDTNIFNYSSNSQDLYIYYGCSDNPIPQVPYRFNCSGNGIQGINFYSPVPVPLETGICRSGGFIVRVSQSAARGLVANPPTTTLAEALGQGFGLRWAVDYTSCERCVQSGGNCGYISSTNAFACYCNDQPYPDRCIIGTNGSPDGNGLANRIKVAIGLSAGFAGIIVVSFVIFSRRRYKLFSGRLSAWI